MTDSIKMWSIGFENRIFPIDKAMQYPYLLVFLEFRTDLLGKIQIEIVYRGLKSLPCLLSHISTRRACLYRTSDGVALMWTKDYFSDIECFINPLAFEWKDTP